LRPDFTWLRSRKFKPLLIVVCALGVTNSAGDFSPGEFSRSRGCTGCQSGLGTSVPDAVFGLSKLNPDAAVPTAIAPDIDSPAN
jgi:hypothetical protein